MLLAAKKFFIIIILLIIAQCTFNSTPPTESEPEISKSNRVPKNPMPADKSLEQPLVLTLKWEVYGAIKFDVYFDKKNPPQILFANDIKTSSIIVSNLEYNTTYYWRVIAKFEDGSKIDGPIWSFTTLTQSYTTLNGYALNLYKVETKVPNYVYILFQVLDLNGTGVSSLTKEDFEIYEDGELISQTESELLIQKRETIPYKLKTVLMLDNSTSLSNNIEQIRNLAKSFIDKITEQQEISIYQFSEKPEMLCDFTSNKDSLIRALDKYKLGYSTTNLYGAVVKGASLWSDKYTIDEVVQGMMIIFTDGKDTQGSTTLSQALNAIHNKMVFTIGLGDEIQPEILQAIGNAGFYPITSISELEYKLNKVQESIVNFANSFYILTYRSPKRGNFNHTLTIRIKNNPYNGDKSEIRCIFNSNNFYSN
ncbi:MAG: VWA domain-containing protein [Melioribacter sp.]|nr:VWA domain-containing protein [Melioribacter sp.]